MLQSKPAKHKNLLAQKNETNQIIFSMPEPEDEGDARPSSEDEFFDEGFEEAKILDLKPKLNKKSIRVNRGLNQKVLLKA